MPSVVGVKGVNAIDVGYVVSENTGGPVGPLNSALNMVDKKVRNLEKRKCKLDGYRADSERGKELNNDQKSAIAKYDEVLHTLEFARELSAQFRSLCQEDDRIKKKAAKRENAERNRYEAGRVTQILKLQSLIKKANSVSEWESMTNLDDGTLKGMKAFIDLVNNASSEHASSAEHYLALIDAKPGKKIGDVTYAQLKDAFTTLETALVSAATTTLEQEQQPEEEEPVEPEEETEEEEVVVVENPSSPPQECPQVQEHPETLMPVNGAADHALPPQQEFNFLQESQIDPINMDPAVVVVQHSPPQVFNPQGGHMYPIPFHQTTAAPYHPPQPTMTHSDPPAAPLQPQNEAQELDNEAYHATSKMSHSKNMEPEGQEPNSAQPHPTIEDWSEENEVVRENGGHYRGRGRGGRGGYRAPRKDNGYRGARGGRGGRSRGGGAGNMNGTGHHYRGDKEYRGRGGRGTRGGPYRGSVEKSNGNSRD